MNNKGFAITSILFGILILFLLVLVFLLGVLRSQRLRMEKLSDSVNSAIGEVVCDEITDVVDIENKHTIENSGRYIIDIGSNNICYLYVKKNDYISLISGQIKVGVKVEDEVKDEVATLINCDNNGITSATITKYCHYGEIEE